ncbi:hypothetical protein H6758_00950 [Candidatus Nomurabacteria bacterium]|nr:hypothetical protein [Candidatus Nomurabacteria bacterium]
MKIQIKHILIIIAGLIALHFFALLSGMYTCENPVTCSVWVDNIAHGVGGVLCGMIWILFLQTKKSKWFHTKNTVFFSTLLFVVLTAFFWELFELFIFTFFTDFAYELALYSPSLSEAGADVISNTIGGVIFAVFYILKHKNFV